MKVEIKMQEKINSELNRSPSLNKDSILYIHTLIYSVIILFVISAYYLLGGHSFSIKAINKILADTSFLLIGLSLVLSSLCYFFNFADKFIIYRKHLGIIGFFYLLLHIFISLSNSKYGPFPDYYLTVQRFPSFIAALSATFIFLVMALISNRLSIQSLGPKIWKILLRFGFLAYILTLYHFGVKNQNHFIRYLQSSDFVLPPMSLIIFIFGILVILLRAILFVKTRR